MRCKCGIQLFDKDIVDSSKISYESTEHGYVIILPEQEYYIYRCPKCFKTKTVKY